jgi:hypothetical protein
MTSCGHSFCTNCIQQWVDQSSLCPLCRAEIENIRLFYRSFFTGDIITVAQKSFELPFVDDPSEIESEEDDGFVCDEIIYDTESPEHEIDLSCGTTWSAGQRVSMRLPSGQRGYEMDSVWADFHPNRVKSEIPQLAERVNGLARSGQISRDDCDEMLTDLIQGAFSANLKSNMELKLLSRISPRMRRLGTQRPSFEDCAMEEE